MNKLFSGPCTHIDEPCFTAVWALWTPEPLWSESNKIYCCSGCVSVEFVTNLYGVQWDVGPVQAVPVVVKVQSHSLPEAGQRQGLVCACGQVVAVDGVPHGVQDELVTLWWSTGDMIDGKRHQDTHLADILITWYCLKYWHNYESVLTCVVNQAWKKNVISKISTSFNLFINDFLILTSIYKTQFREGNLPDHLMSYVQTNSQIYSYSTRQSS